MGGVVGEGVMGGVVVGGGNGGSSGGSRVMEGVVGGVG